MDNKKYETIVGMEIHVELATATKMFCRCLVPQLSDEPNTRTCPVCLGLPGALPFTNKKAIESCIQIGLALNCTVNENTFFERKNYFYPDLAKGFQTSQFLHPFSEKGYLDIMVPVILGNEMTPESSKDPGQARMTMVKKRIGITRVHMEEDTGKLTHATIDGKEVSLIDFNRSSVPLVEIVTEPDIRSGEEAKIFLTELQKIIRYLNVSDADMDKGQMRLEPNISLRKPGETGLPPYKVEVKNINSFKFVDKAIQIEEIRHKEMLDRDEYPTQETRGWNEFKNKTVSQRSKEDAHDYRYFPEPDIPPISFAESQISNIKSQIPELPDAKTKRFIKDLGLADYNAEILTRDKKLAEFFEKTVDEGSKKGVDAKDIANYIINKKPDLGNIDPFGLLEKRKEETTVEEFDTGKLEEVIGEILDKNPEQVADYKAGKIQLLGFFIGQTKQALPDAKDTDQIRNLLTKMLE